MTEPVTPRATSPGLIVVVALDRGEDGELFAAFGPQIDLQEIEEEVGWIEAAIRRAMAEEQLRREASAGRAAARAARAARTVRLQARHPAR